MLERRGGLGWRAVRSDMGADGTLYALVMALSACVERATLLADPFRRRFRPGALRRIESEATQRAPRKRKTAAADAAKLARPGGIPHANGSLPRRWYRALRARRVRVVPRSALRLDEERADHGV